MSKGGFTYLELLIAVSLFSAGVLTVLEIFPVNRRFLAQSANTTQAAFLAQEEIETMRSLPYNSLTTGTYEASHALGSSSTDPLNQYSRTTTVSLIQDDGSNATWTASASDVGLKKIDVLVSWSERAISRQYKVTTYAFK